ncbi:hypothetical protein BHM03_00012986 [Ensete ventricosum]|nr:hypothetical protein BHM03_00012986 [Ensete ventricosum]
MSSASHSAPSGNGLPPPLPLLGRWEGFVAGLTQNPRVGHDSHRPYRVRDKQKLLGSRPEAFCVGFTFRLGRLLGAQRC